MIVRIAYTVFIGILLATFVGVGIAAFYPGPKQPEYPIELTKPRPIGSDGEQWTEEEIKKQQESEKERRVFEKQSQIYSKNVSIIAVSASVIILAISLIFLKTILFLADGLLLGGVLTLLYSIIRGFQSEDEKFRFIVVSIGLAIALFLGYIKFIKSKK
ncbi:MAG: hypothetical protein Q7S60_05450 [bacterium]|nr:hypothetical protein [bacterium]